MVVDVTGKVVVITGSSRGIGRELAKAYAKEKAKVVINYHKSEKQAKELYQEILEYNKDCLLLRADVTNPTAVQQMYQVIVKYSPRVDVLINNAGICDDNKIQNMSFEQWKSVIDVNLTGVFLCCKQFSKIMMEQQSGKIINIASVKGQEGSAEQVNYSSSKAGIISLTKSLARELGEYNIAVNAVCPGFVVTDLNRNITYKKEIAEKRSLIKSTNAIQDFVNFTIYLSSDQMLGGSGRVFNLDSRI